MKSERNGNPLLELMQFKLFTQMKRRRRRKPPANTKVCTWHKFRNHFFILFLFFVASLQLGNFILLARHAIGAKLDKVTTWSSRNLVLLSLPLVFLFSGRFAVF